MVTDWEEIKRLTKAKIERRIGEVKLRGAKGRSIEELGQDRSSWKRFH